MASLALEVDSEKMDVRGMRPCFDSCYSQMQQGAADARRVNNRLDIWTLDMTQEPLDAPALIGQKSSSTCTDMHRGTTTESRKIGNLEIP